MELLSLKENPTLRDYQDYIAKMIVERGFDKETVPELFLLLMEECGELAKAVRKSETNIKFDKTSKDYRVDLEAADVFMYILDICNHLGVDLEKAFREKETLNAQREWLDKSTNS